MTDERDAFPEALYVGCGRGIYAAPAACGALALVALTEDRSIAVLLAGLAIGLALLVAWMRRRIRRICRDGDVVQAKVLRRFTRPIGEDDFQELLELLLVSGEAAGQRLELEVSRELHACVSSHELIRLRRLPGRKRVVPDPAWYRERVSGMRPPARRAKHWSARRQRRLSKRRSKRR